MESSLIQTDSSTRVIGGIISIVEEVGSSIPMETTMRENFKMINPQGMAHSISPMAQRCKEILRIISSRATELKLMRMAHDLKGSS